VEDGKAEAGRSRGRAYVVEELGKHGLSRRQAVQVINAVFAEMGRALARGQRVVFPFGHLERVLVPVGMGTARCRLNDPAFKDAARRQSWPI